MLKYVKVDSDGYTWLDGSIQQRLRKLGYHVARANDEWLLFRMTNEGGQFNVTALIYETTDHVLFDNYLKLLLED